MNRRSHLRKAVLAAITGAFAAASVQLSAAPAPHAAPTLLADPPRAGSAPAAPADPASAASAAPQPAAPATAAPERTAAPPPAGPAGRAPTRPADPVKNVSFLGCRTQIPASWPVISLRGARTACVRFDRHAAYLGMPGPAERCPAHLIAATTEALLIEPLRAVGAGSATFADPTAHQYVVTDAAAGVEITATYGTDQALMEGILAGASGEPGGPAASPVSGPQPRPQRAAHVPATPSAGAPPPAPFGKVSGPAPQSPVPTLPPLTPPSPPHGFLPPTVPTGFTNGIGRGFDACAAPGPAAMSAWMSRSPYRAVGIYIGGADRACAQPNLTAGWVSRQAAEAGISFPCMLARRLSTARSRRPSAKASVRPTTRSARQ